MPVDNSKHNNHFIPITNSARALLLAYFAIYIVYQPAVLTYFSQDSNWMIYILGVLYESLLFLPILFYRKQYGWLHPLIFPLIFNLARKIGANPEMLFGIFFPEPLSDYVTVSHILFYDWRQGDLDFAFMWGQVLNIIALLAYYVAFFYSNPKQLQTDFMEPKNLKPKVFTIVAMSIIVFTVYLSFKGGISSHLLSWAQGRFNALAGDGPIFVLVKMAPFAVLIWYAFDKKAERNVWFWILLVATAPLQFVLTGSRSSIVYFGTLFLLIAIWKKGRVPKMRVVFFGILAIVLIGLLGNVRSSTFTGNVELPSIFEISVLELVEDTQEEMKRRSESNGYLAVVAMVPDEVDYLYGESYIGTLLFFIPRYIWEGKPRGAGAISGERIFNKSSGAGIPPGPVGEAYWNFSLLGVVLIFLLYGVLHKWLAVNMVKYHDEPGYFIIYIITLTIFSPTGIAIVSYFQTIIPVILIMRWMGVLKWKNRNHLKLPEISN